MAFEERLKININKGSISEALAKHPTLIYQYGVKLEELQNLKHVQEERLEYLESKKALSIRNKYSRVKSKPLSETMIKELVAVDDEIVLLRQKLNETKRLYGLAKLKMKSLEIKLSSMENIGHNIREESKSGRSKL